MSYKDVMPKAFPYVVHGPPGTIQFLAQQLTNLPFDRGAPSSFAVTTELWPNKTTLWMSEASFKRLDEAKHFTMGVGRELEPIRLERARRVRK